MNILLKICIYHNTHNLPIKYVCYFFYLSKKELKIKITHILYCATPKRVFN